MALSFAEVRELLESIARAVPDQLNCLGCSELLAEFAESEIRGLPLTEALSAARTHMEQCPCCAYEYLALLEAIRAADAEDSRGRDLV